MANAVEVIKLTSALIPQYDGNADKLSNIIAALTALKAVIVPATEPIAVQMVLSKLEKRARTAVGDNPVNIDDIIAQLKARCQQQVSADVILAQLNATKQTGALDKFSEEIEEYTNRLELAYINDHIPAETASRMATKAGVKALAAGVRNDILKIILKAGQFDTLSSAICKAFENEAYTLKCTYGTQSGNGLVPQQVLGGENTIHEENLTENHTT